MTLQDKAKKIHRRYMYILNDARIAKRCAIIAVDEKIELYNEINEYGHLLPNSFGFELHEMKQEIEKL